MKTSAIAFVNGMLLSIAGLHAGERPLRFLFVSSCQFALYLWARAPQETEG